METIILILKHIEEINKKIELASTLKDADVMTLQKYLARLRGERNRLMESIEILSKHTSALAMCLELFNAIKTKETGPNYYSIEFGMNTYNALRKIVNK